ncbi:MAG: DUF4143 domain-containing protein [Lentisphaeria bacterium]|nr:DUF4143 domain-containing protein [Lentisphaeria bacterium]
MFNLADYKDRSVDNAVAKALATFGCVCIEGPKWSGKTWTSVKHSRSQFYLGDPEGNFQNRTLTQLSPAAVLKGDKPRLLDEWQEVPSLWDAVRFAVDQAGAPGQFILTGSSTPKRKGILHSGAGRIVKLQMRTMSLFESGDSSGKVSLLGLFDHQCPAQITGDVSLENLIYLVVRGGWPASIERPRDNAASIPLAYVNLLLDEDVFKIDDIRRNRRKLELLLRSLARNESTTASMTRLQTDVKEKDMEDISTDTIAEYLDLFSRMFLLANQPPFSPAMRSSVRLKQAEKRHLTDPSLACALLRATPAKLLADLNTFGFLFEALCERDLDIYARTLGGTLYHYQDFSGREVDAIVELPDGQFAAFEIKLGAQQIDEAAKNLLAFSDHLEKAKVAKPVFLCVLCGMSSSAYQRQDSVFVVPITALKP